MSDLLFAATILGQPQSAKNRRQAVWHEGRLRFIKSSAALSYAQATILQLKAAKNGQGERSTIRNVVPVRIVPFGPFTTGLEGPLFDYEVIPVTYPLTGDVALNLTVYLRSRQADLVGCLELLADCLQKAGVVCNDRSIVSVMMNRKIDRQNPRVQVRLTRVETGHDT